ncbi:MAG TPA: alpha/beta fold hydrolase [Candidatus Binataceae bacterium]|nr:alpha/beta fold hydrolase [Candidatus Binataceae bacterium]HVB78936.1 alpha/beta fold hydrolase [Candidatus Binataceae bacterium]
MSTDSIQPCERQVLIDEIPLMLVEGGRGAPLLVLHDELGYPGWLAWNASLAEHRRLIIPMAPGFGRSPGLDWLSSLRDLACLYGRFLRDNGFDRVDVLGFSLGGWLAAEMAVNWPGQFARMMLVAPMGIKPSEGEILDLFMRSAPEYLRAGICQPASCAEYLKLYGRQPTQPQLEQWEEARAQVARLAWSPYMHNPSLPSLLRGVRSMPTLLVWGERDAVVPAATARRYQESIPDAQIALLRECGHRPEIERTQEFVNIIRQFIGS